jgi:hypothetical protein
VEHLAEQSEYLASDAGTVPVYIVDTVLMPKAS